MTQNFDANSTDANSFILPNIRTYEQTNGRTDERKDESYILIGINAGAIKLSYNGLYAFMIGASDTNKGGHDVVFNVAGLLD